MAARLAPGSDHVVDAAPRFSERSDPPGVERIAALGAPSRPIMLGMTQAFP